MNPKYQNSEKPLKIRLEMDEMWGRVYCKGTPCWLRRAINHDNGDVAAFVLGSREHGTLWDLLNWLRPQTSKSPLFARITTSPIATLFRRTFYRQENAARKKLSGNI